MSASVYARCTEPTTYPNLIGNVREGCGWTGEVERVEYHNPADPCVNPTTCPAQIMHDGEGRWPWDIDACPACGGTIEVDK